MKLLGVAALTTAFFVTVAKAEETPAPTMVSLSTGSRVATWMIAPPTVGHKTPVVFLHGGPGLYTEASRFGEGAVLRAAGFATIYFDQAGGGRSDWLAAKDYTLDRAVTDLEALRIKLGRERLILWGNSYGASLAAIYATRFPARVAGLILTSPGTFPGTNPKRNYAITNRDKVKWSKAFSVALGDVDKLGADAEVRVTQVVAGLAFDEVVAAELIEGMVCKGAKISPPALTGGGNLFANRLILKQVEKLDFKPTATSKIPTLVVRGACDFLPDSNAAAYATMFGTTVTTIPAAGHGLLENRATVEAALRAFAKGQLANADN
jgi:pimeloyl-ACP methyl ester carboxylesterase